MKLIDKIFINLPAQAVWAFLENPANMPLWNPKVKRVSTMSSDAPKLGYRYAITYQMHERADAAEFLAEFVDFEPFSRLRIRLTGNQAPHNRIIYEIYELSQRDGGTFLTQIINIENSGVNIIFRLLIWIIQRWGKPTGTRYLETLRDIVQNSQNDGSQ